MTRLLKFPKGFYWGASTSSHQVEGGNKNDWTVWEKENAERLAREARDFWEPWQKEKFPEMFDPNNYISGRACDHYNRYEEDFDFMKDLGMNAHRLSIEWSRIEPGKGKFDEKEIEHYRKVIYALRRRGIEPFVTLWHFTVPLWVLKNGGWMNRETSADFVEYVEYVVRHLGADVRFWITQNEPTLYSFATNLSIKPWLDWPSVHGGYRGWFRMSRYLVIAHKRAYRVIKEASVDHQVGIANSRVFFDARGINPASWSFVFLARHFHNEWFFRRIRKYQDFVGINYFTHNRIRAGFRNPRRWFNRNDNKVISDFGWELYPEGIYKVVKSASRYRVPIYITENGIADADDEKRAVFIKDTLAWLHKAISEGSNVMGYFHWSLLDNFEWASGFWTRFGLVEVDYKNNLRRRVRPSTYEYAKIIKANAIPSLE